MQTSGSIRANAEQPAAAGGPAGQVRQRAAQVAPLGNALPAVPHAPGDRIAARGADGRPNNMYGADDLPDPGSPVGRVMIPQFVPGQSPPPAPRRAVNPRRFDNGGFVIAPVTPELPARARRRFEESPATSSADATL